MGYSPRSLKASDTTERLTLREERSFQRWEKGAVCPDVWRGTEQGGPHSCAGPGEEGGSREGRQPVLSPLCFRGMGLFLVPFFLQLNIEGNELYC